MPGRRLERSQFGLRRRQPRLGGGDRLSQRAVVGIGGAFRQLRLGDPALRLGRADGGVGGVDRRGAGLLGDHQLRLRVGVGLLRLGGRDVEGGDPLRRVRLAGVRIDGVGGMRRVADGRRRIANRLGRVAGGTGAGDQLVLFHTRRLCRLPRSRHRPTGVVDRLHQLEALRFRLWLLGVVERLASVGEGPLGCRHSLSSGRHLGALLVRWALGGVAGIGVHLLDGRCRRRVEDRVDGAGVVAEPDHCLLELGDVGALGADHQPAIHRQLTLQHEHRPRRDLEQHVALLDVSADLTELGDHGRLARIEPDGAGERDAEWLVVGDLTREYDLRRELPALDGHGHQRRGRRPACRRPVSGRLDLGTDPHARRPGQATAAITANATRRRRRPSAPDRFRSVASSMLLVLGTDIAGEAIGASSSVAATESSTATGSSLSTVGSVSARSSIALRPLLRSAGAAERRTTRSPN